MEDSYKNKQTNVSCTDKICRIDSLKNILGISTLHQLKDNNTYWKDFISLVIQEKVSSELMKYIAGFFGITQNEFTDKCHIDYCRPLKERCEDFLKVYDFAEADNIYKANLKYINHDWYDKSRNHYYNLMKSTIKEELAAYLNEFLQLHKTGMQRTLWNQDYPQQLYDNELITDASKRILDMRDIVIQLPNDLDSLTIKQNEILAIFSKSKIDLSKMLECEKQKDIDSLNALYAPWKTVLKLENYTRVTHLLLTENDHSLISKWSISNGPNSYRGKAMTSARKAELAALELYRNLYGSAEDISILQVTSSQDSRWKYADIVANGQWIDIKNARASFSSPDTYSEHCVPQFKLDRNNKDVLISTFLSPYREDERSIIWLGEASLEQIGKLQKEFNSQYLSITFANNLNGSFLPAWLFDYPSVCYKDRDIAISRIRLSNFVFPRKECDIGSGVLANRVISSKTQGILGSEAMKLELRIKNSGLSRAVLFLHVLDRFCNYSLNNKIFKNSNIDKILFLSDDNNKEIPLGVYDPLKTIWNLWNVLVSVSEKCREKTKGFTAFRLRGANILQGKNPDDSWSTIYAYCGGWRKKNDEGTVKCGQNPIYLGKDHSCPYCGRLICHCCGFCSSVCPGCKARQDKWSC